MSLMKFIHSSTKTICLFILAITHSFNYMSYIPFLILILREKEKMELDVNLYIIIYFIIYDIIKYFTNNITLKINRFIGDHAYYALSICFLSVINLIFSFLSFSYKNILTFLFHRFFISLFNNIAPYINLPLSLFYKRNKIPYKKRNFSFLQKISNFMFFLFFLINFQYSKNFSFFCFFLAFLNSLCFIISLAILGCNRENINNKYYPSISERDNINGNFVSYQFKQKNNNIRKERKDSAYEQKTNKQIIDNSDNNNENNDIAVNIENNNNSINNNNNNLSTNTNNIDNIIEIKQKNLDITNNNNGNNNNNNNNSSFMHNNSINNKMKIKIEENINEKELRNNNSQTIRGFLFPFLFSDNSINPNLYPKKIKFIISLLLLFTALKSINIISLFMLIFKVNKISIVSFVDKNNNGLLFSDFSNNLKISTIIEEYLFLFMCYNFINIALYLINIAYTFFALKKKSLNSFFYYLSFIIFIISCMFFIYYYLKNANNVNNEVINIRKDIILCFVFHCIVNESSMIMSINYNIIGKKKGFGEKMLKDIKSLTVFFAGLLFVVIQCIIAIVDTKTTFNQFENYIFYIVFTSLILIILIISILFL